MTEFLFLNEFIQLIIFGVDSRNEVNKLSFYDCHIGVQSPKVSTNLLTSAIFVAEVREPPDIA